MTKTPAIKLHTLVGALLAVVLVAASCGGSGGSHRAKSAAGTASGQFGGTVDGTQAQIGIAAGKERVTVYLCDNGTISEWFITDHPASELTIASKDGAVAAVKFAGDLATGTITLSDGSDHAFRATSQPHPVIHRAEAATEAGAVLAGWVTVGNRTTGSLSINQPGLKSIVNPAPTLPAQPTLSLPTGTLSSLTSIVTITGDSTFVTANRAMTFVIGGVGDSYASGEGNPVSPPSSVVDKPTNLATMWGPEFGMNGCHRSDDAAIPRAFRALKAKHPGFNIRLAFAACGGSKIEHVTGRPGGSKPFSGGVSYGDGVRGDATGERTDRWDAINEPAQLEQVDTRVRGFGTGLPVDLLVMSIGGNDAGFAPVVGLCVKGGVPTNIDGIDPQATVLGLADPTPCDKNTDLATALDQNGPPAGSALASSVPGWNEVLRRYDALDATLEAFSVRQRPIGQVLIDHYAAGLKNTDGTAYCGGRSATTKDDLFGFIDPSEAAWLDTNLIGGLNTAIDSAVVAANAGAAGPRWKASGADAATFRNHGPCAAEPWTNINATALKAEGNNLPDPPDDTTRPSLAQLNTALATATGAAIGCGAGAITVFFTAAGCAAGAATGLIVGLATNATESAVSAGMAHPNKLGWRQVGDALLPEFDAAFQRTFTPLPPSRAREFGASENGDIVVRWDDRSSTETRYEVEIFDDANRTTPVIRQTNLAANSTTFTFKPNKAFVGTAHVRACNSEFCSPFGASVKITNIKAGVPTNLSALVYANHALAADLPDTLVVLATDPHNADTATRVELTQLTDAAGNTLRALPKTFDVPAPFASVFTIGGTDGIAAGKYRVRAASCNLLGCSGFGPSAESSPAPPGPPNLKLELLPPFVVDKLGLTRPRLGPQVQDPGSGSPPSTIPRPGV